MINLDFVQARQGSPLARFSRLALIGLRFNPVGGGRRDAGRSVGRRPPARPCAGSTPCLRPLWTSRAGPSMIPLPSRNRSRSSTNPKRRTRPAWSRSRSFRLRAEIPVSRPIVANSAASGLLFGVLRDQFLADGKLRPSLGSTTLIETTDARLWDEVHRALLRVPDPLAREWKAQAAGMAKSVGCELVESGPAIEVVAGPSEELLWPGLFGPDRGTRSPHLDFGRACGRTVRRRRRATRPARGYRRGRGLPGSPRPESPARPPKTRRHPGRSTHRGRSTRAIPPRAHRPIPEVGRLDRPAGRSPSPPARPRRSASTRSCSAQSRPKTPGGASSRRMERNSLRAVEAEARSVVKPLSTRELIGPYNDEIRSFTKGSNGLEARRGRAARRSPRLPASLRQDRQRRPAGPGPHPLNSRRPEGMKREHLAIAGAPSSGVDVSAQSSSSRARRMAQTGCFRSPDWWNPSIGGVCAVVRRADRVRLLVDPGRRENPARGRPQRRGRGLSRREVPDREPDPPPDPAWARPRRIETRRSWRISNRPTAMTCCTPASSARTPGGQSPRDAHVVPGPS